MTSPAQPKIAIVIVEVERLRVAMWLFIHSIKVFADIICKSLFISLFHYNFSECIELK